MDIILQVLGYFNTPIKSDSVKDELIDNNNDLTVPNLNSPNKKYLLQQRQKLIGSKCQIFYEKDPVVVDRAKMQYIYDECGKKYIDCISNVQHVGHCHPLVVQRIHEQMQKSNCNVRFVSSKLTECAEAILETLPAQLDTVLFCNSG